jgi:hypothetical protein
MGKVWVLRTETKGTGAEMVPLEKVLRQPGSTVERSFVTPKARRRPVQAPEPRPPRRFKVVDVMSRQVLAEDADARTTVDALGAVRRRGRLHVGREGGAVATAHASRAEGDVGASRRRSAGWPENCMSAMNFSAHPEVQGAGRARCCCWCSSSRRISSTCGGLGPRSRHTQGAPASARATARAV